MTRRNRSGLPEHCSWNFDRHGKRRVRFRKGGFSIYLSGTPWSDQFMRQYAAALDGVKAEAKEIGAERTIPGSIDALIVSYYKLVFPTLKPSTQAVRRNILERFRANHGKKPVNRIDHQHVAAIIAAKANTPHAANNLRSVLGHLFQHAIAINMRISNPVRSVKKLKTGGDGFHTWTEEEIAQFVACYPVGSRAHLALTLMLWTGQRGSDVVRMGWQHVRNGQLAVRQQKTDAPLLIPIAPELAEALALLPRTNLTFLLADRGAPFTAKRFSEWFRERCDEAGIPQCTAHGLRKACATRLAELGCGEREIAAITGHKSMSEVARYTKAASQARLAQQAMEKLSAGRTKQQADLSNLPTRLDKTAVKPLRQKS